MECVVWFVVGVVEVVVFSGGIGDIYIVVVFSCVKIDNVLVVSGFIVIDIG